MVSVLVSIKHEAHFKFLLSDEVFEQIYRGIGDGGRHGFIVEHGVDDDGVTGVWIVDDVAESGRGVVEEWG